MALDIHAKEVQHISLDHEIQAYLPHVLNDLVQFLMIWSHQDGIICVQDIDGFASGEDTFFQLALVEANKLELAHQVLVPNMTCLLLAIDVLVDLEYIVSISFYHKTLWDFHVHIPFDWGLHVGHDKVDLLGMPALDDGLARMRQMEPHVVTGA